MEQSYEELESVTNKLINLYRNKIVEIQMQKPKINTMNEEDDTVHLSKELSQSFFRIKSHGKNCDLFQLQTLRPPS